MRKRPLILIVDDEPFNVDYLEQELEDLEFDTVSAFNGQEALEQVAATSPDMILLDIMMPIMDGFQVLERLKTNKEWRDIPVVVISAMSDLNSVARGIESGAEDFLPKPFDPVLLQARLHAGLEKKRLRDQEVEYLRQVAHLTQAAQAIEENRFAAESLVPVAARDDALGNLGRVFLRMAEEVHAREQRLQQQITQLKLDLAERQEAAAETAVVYLPMDRRQALAGATDLPSPTSGAALFADISGFTPLTAALVRELGRQRGAEEIVRHLNRVFGALVDQVHQYHGSVIGFSGDALTCWFDAGFDDPPAALRALACGLAMQATMGQFDEITTSGGQRISLGIKVAAAGGTVRRFLVGDPHKHNLEAMAGSVLDRLSEAEHLAGRGELLATADLVAELGEQVLIASALQNGEQSFVRVSGLREEVPVTPWPELAEDNLTAEEAARWLLPAVYDQVRAGQSENLSQLRPATALFLQFGGLDYENDPGAGEKLDRFVCWVQEVLAANSGNLLDLIIGDKGSYLYAVFGAPLALEADAAVAVATALELADPPANLADISGVSIGITRGLMRAGAYGSPTRRTYSALGEATNLAARLMQAAGAGVLVDSSVYEETQRQFDFDTLAPIQVKGKEELVPVYRPLARRALARYRRMLDELEPMLQTTLKLAGVLGEEFDADTLQAIYPDSAAQTQIAGWLQQLVDRELLVAADGRYRFVDPLLRDTAYETMLFAQRRRLHRAAAEWFESRYADDPGAHYVLIAYHWERAEDTSKTLAYLELAAAQARERGDLETALALYDRTLALQTNGM